MSVGLSSSVLTRLFLLTCNKDESAFHTAEYHERYFYMILDDMQKFCSVFPDGLPVAGKRVLDMGCGHGSASIYFALHGATESVGMDINAEYVDFARNKLRTKYASLGDRVRFTTDMADVEHGRFDVVVSRDTMEHVASPDGYLKDAAARLRPGGRMYVGFAPLWNSPFGGHGRMKTRLPWGHILFPERVIMAGLGSISKDFRSKSIVELGLNKLSFRELHNVLSRSEFRTLFFAPNVPTLSLKNKVVTALRKVPGLTEYLTHSAYFILERTDGITSRSGE